MPELKPCPFCGGEVSYLRTNHKSRYNRTHSYNCAKCNATIFLDAEGNYINATETNKEAIETFNRCLTLYSPTKNKYIIADKVIDDILCMHIDDCLDFAEIIIKVKEIIEAQPTADVAEVKHGYWFLLDECANEGVYCSVCHKKVYKKDYANQKVKSKYCPNCGVRMDGTNEAN